MLMAIPFKKLQEKWYKKLEKEGFKDIENFSLESRPLKEWHNFKFKRAKFGNELYQDQIQNLLNHKDFDEYCKMMVKHGNCKFTKKQVREIWELHVQGLSTRKIAKKMKRVKARIDDIIKGLRTWMKLTL